MSGDLLPIERVRGIASWGICWQGCPALECAAVLLAREVLERRGKEGAS